MNQRFLALGGPQLMFWEPLDILLTPQQVIVKGRKPGASHKFDVSLAPKPLVAPGQGTDWHAAASALRSALAGRRRGGTRIRVVLSDGWVRYDLTPMGSGGLNEDESLLLAHTHFARQYPETGNDSWILRIALQKECMLAVGIESALLEALREAAASAGAPLSGIEPLFTWVFDRHRMDLVKVSGWLLLDEPGMLTLASIESGQLTSLHAQRCESDPEYAAVQLLERQSALLSRRSVDVCVISAGNRVLRLPVPWRTLWHRSVADFDRTASAAVAGHATTSNTL